MYKTDFHDFEDLVNCLSEEKEAVEICKRLQDINEKFLKEYFIQVKEYTIEPLLVESYYRNGCTFADSNVHGSNKQKDRFGKLYFHEKGRGGVDICLSCGDYYFSLLIKNSLVAEKGKPHEFYRQTKLYDALKDSKDLDEIVLKKRKNANDTIVFHTIRKGLVKNDCFRNEPLASVIGFELKDLNKQPYRFDLEKGHTKEYLVSKYIEAHPGMFTESEFKVKFLDYIPKGIKGLLR